MSNTNITTIGIDLGKNTFLDTTGAIANLRLVLAWLRILLSLILITLSKPFAVQAVLRGLLNGQLSHVSAKQP